MFDVKKIREDFPMFKNNPGLIYFDNGATALKPQCVIDAVVDYYERYSVNVHRGDYDLSYKADSMYDSVRDTVASFIHCSPKEVVFTAGASFSLNQIAYGLRKSVGEGDVILTTEIEHASSILPFFRICEETGAKIEYVPLDKEGQCTSESFRSAMHDKVKIVVMAQVSNVLGVVQPVKECIQIAHEFGAICVVDGAQSIPHLPVDVKDMDCDFLAFSAHKCCGPTGVGVLYGKYELLDKMEPMFLGGTSNARFDRCGNIILQDTPNKFETGTQHIAGVIGMKAALEYLQSIGMSDIEAYEAELKRYLFDKLSELDNVELYNEHAPTGIVPFNFKGIFAQDAAGYLNSKGIAVRTGNHCAKIVKDVIGTNETIRASLYFYNTKEEIDRFVEVCKEVTLDKCVGIFF